MIDVKLQGVLELEEDSNQSFSFFNRSSTREKKV